MGEENRTVPGQSNSTGADAERARLRRNQRNSRARKQAYIQGLEQRWSQCVRLGAQATTEMQKEARRVQEENLLLRAILRNEGFDDAGIQRALESAKLAEGGTCQPQDLPSGLAIASSVDCNPQPLQEPSVLPTARVPQQKETQEDLSQSLDVHDWLTDLCNIKDAFGAEVNFNDRLSQNNLDQLGTLSEDPMQFAIDNSQYELPPFPGQAAYPTNSSSISANDQWGQLDSLDTFYIP
ncbi:hypothetical protein F4677DRAFT_438296 [Hypoxylon crocopeplum]|nr:hypothetical protein F4677DRAFT_438296 [Hypoxylon crocopeplum]